MAYIPGRKKRKPKAEEGGEEKEHKDTNPVDIDVEKLKAAYESLADMHRQIWESHIEMILNLAIAAEYKDPDTGNHILRISDYATEVARAIDLPNDEMEILRYASPMHDIGKIGIPDKILQKPGKLDAAEWEVMKTHTLIGARMFQSSKSPLLKAAAQIAVSHHERFDGTGYPHGTRGEAIPLFGRIVAMVDVFDAIVSERCYKSKSTFHEGMNYIQNLAGSHLDPALVAVFLKHHKEICKVYEANTAIHDFIKEFNEQRLL